MIIRSDEIYRRATLDYGIRWLDYNLFPNNKNKVIKIHTNYVTLNLNKVLQLTLPIYFMYCTVFYNEMVSRGIHNYNY